MASVETSSRSQLIHQQADDLLSLIVGNRPAMHLGELVLPVVDPRAEGLVECIFGILRRLDRLDLLLNRVCRPSASNSA